ncbi:MULTISPECIES: acetyl-CoA C-acetyltransferase [Acidiplasma]|jgi:acetyl-CoA C-acetyltransferase|uniref:Acetyl-CoA acetyltransferase n=2 Tax=Acidiplasma TaxID=507753 RepID=A0A0Q1B8B2_9ARCH|nr:MULTISPECIES: acetyl-CoA C-acetyltransferase [Acidiplasma]KJE49153.1 acetyl-CoA acetyltransferase [Acidiplasma sp. MBA-1]KPV46940.1 acetyl-CoA acetyltransferase [Acidiplasma aeolicum]KQB34916.1 acetyl-CoA acetyltransferase [Acidiplasma aeolicum]KQB36511.1 acetyl-CoA acetyltransferase [Acidiplasma cupricumulans]WMT54908.1 MAG: acetyl-CoA C-acetyltransferase [Acidiplasma sp.]
MLDTYIVSAKRTPIGKFGKSLARVKATELGGVAIKGVIDDSRIDKDLVEEVIMGNVIQAGVGQNPAGQAAFYAGLRDEVTKNTVNVVCASGMLAVENAAREIALGEHDIIIAGGMENMSASPLLLNSEFRWGPKQLLYKNFKVEDSMLVDGLIDAMYNEHMGVSAEGSARKYGITRKDADEFSVESQERALRATESGEFSKEIVPLKNLEKDEGIRKTTMEDLEKLVPAFDRNGILTAGSSSQLSDGASALLLASKKAVDEYGLKPIAKITGFASASMNPRDFVEAPIPATRKLLEKQGKNIDYYDLVEHNEAFSVASIIVRDQLGIDPERFNVNGGAIAIGHPLGNSGSRIIVTLINALKSRKLNTGLATICHGGGGGHSLSLEMIY